MDPKKIVELTADWYNEAPAAFGDLPKDRRADALIEKILDKTHELQNDPLDLGGLLNNFAAEFDRKDLELLDSLLRD